MLPARHSSKPSQTYLCPLLPPSPPSLFSISLKNCLNPSLCDLDCLPQRIKKVVKNCYSCEVCQRVCIDMKGQPGSSYKPSSISWRGLPYHSTYIEEYWCEWDILKDLFDDGPYSDSSYTRLPLSRSFCIDCFWIHIRYVLKLKPSCPCFCVTCSQEKHSSRPPIRGLTRASISYLSRLR